MSRPGLCSGLLMLVDSQQITTHRARCQIQPLVVYAGQPVVPSSCPKLAADGAAEPTMADIGLWDWKISRRQAASLSLPPGSAAAGSSRTLRCPVPQPCQSLCSCVHCRGRQRSPRHAPAALPLPSPLGRLRIDTMESHTGPRAAAVQSLWSLDPWLSQAPTMTSTQAPSPRDDMSPTVSIVKL